MATLFCQAPCLAFHGMVERLLIPTAVSILSILLWFSSPSIVIADQLPSSDELGRRIEGQWDAQRSGLITGAVSIRAYHYVDVAHTVPLDTKFFEQWAGGLNPQAIREALVTLKQNLPPPKKPKAVMYWDVPVEIVFEANKIKNIQEWAGGKSTEIFDGKDTLRRNGPNKQVSVIPGRAASVLIGLPRLHFIPRIDRSVSDKYRRISTKPNNRAVLHYGNTSEFEVDADTGFVYSAIDRDAAGKVTLRTWQYKPIPLPGDLFLPTIKIDASYNVAGAITLATIYYIESAEANISLPADSFRLDVPKDFTVVDFRANPRDPPRARTTEPVNDVLAHVDAAGFGAKPVPRTSRSAAAMWAGGFAGVFVMAVVVRLAWRRRIKPGSGVSGADGSQPKVF